MKEIEKDGNDTVDIIKCPHCEHLMGYDDLEIGELSGNFDMKCEKCKKAFNVDFTSMFYFTTKNRGRRVIIYILAALFMFNSVALLIWVCFTESRIQNGNKKNRGKEDGCDRTTFIPSSCGFEGSP